MQFKNRYDKWKVCGRHDIDVKDIFRHQASVKIVLITPYLVQKKFLQNGLRKVKHMENRLVSTVYSIQGQEVDVVIISTVRTNKIGSIDDHQRLNIALTRVTCLVRIVGCKV